MSEDTKTIKMLREGTLARFLEQIKHDVTWRQWLNGSNELHIARVCKHLGETGGKGKPWDASCFRGCNWAVPYKETFNKWVKHQMAADMAARDTDLFGNPLRNTIVLPPGLSLDGLAEEMIDFLKDKLAEVKRLKERVVTLESQLNAKDRMVLELITQVDSLAEAERARDEHYLFSIRSLKYDD